MTDKLNHIEVAEVSQIKVNAKLGSNIWDVAKECIALANLLKVSVKLYFNGRYVHIYVDSKVNDIVQTATK